MRSEKKDLYARCSGLVCVTLSSTFRCLKAQMTKQKTPTNIFYFMLLIFRLNSFFSLSLSLCMFQIRNSKSKKKHFVKRKHKLAYITRASLHFDTQIQNRQTDIVYWIGFWYFLSSSFQFLFFLVLYTIWEKARAPGRDGVTSAFGWYSLFSFFAIIFSFLCVSSFPTIYAQQYFINIIIILLFLRLANSPSSSFFSCYSFINVSIFISLLLLVSFTVLMFHIEFFF